jgi:hypothetical protein
MKARNGFVVAALVAAPAVAHHGIGTFDTKREITISGAVTGIDFVNPHAYLYLDAAGADGKVAAWKCEMRSATTLRRSGWSPEMFKPGTPVTITGAPDRNDPSSCYLSTIVFADGTSADRYGQLSQAPAARPAAERAARLPSGEPNISGDWAPEQLVMTDPRGRGGALVPLSQAPSFEPGASTAENARQYRTRDVALTPEGQKAANAFETYNPQHNPRMRCETTSIIFDWTYDGAVNRITQAGDTVTLEYGQYGFTRTIHLNQATHPANIEPSRAGHSIGRWENDVLVVDTVGLAPGVLSPPVMHTDQLHVVERFSLDPNGPTLLRSYTAEDPAYLAGTYSGSDMLAVADIAYSPDKCTELTNHATEAPLQPAAPAAAKPWWKFWD